MYISRWVTPRGDVAKEKIECQPIRTREIGGARLSEKLYVRFNGQNREIELIIRIAWWKRKDKMFRSRSLIAAPCEAI